MKGRNVIDLPTIAVFVPASADMPIAQLVDRGSAIVGCVTGDEAAEQVTVYFEGNRYGYANVQTLADRARIAAGRLIEHYPTVAFAVVSRRDLLKVGWYEREHGIILLRDRRVHEALAAWLSINHVTDSELHFSIC